MFPVVNFTFPSLVITVMFENIVRNADLSKLDRFVFERLPLQNGTHVYRVGVNEDGDVTPPLRIDDAIELLPKLRDLLGRDIEWDESVMSNPECFEWNYDVMEHVTNVITFEGNKVNREAYEDYYSIKIFMTKLAAAKFESAFTGHIFDAE